jgi:hypothetical protein
MIGAIFRLTSTIAYSTSEDFLYPASETSLWSLAEMTSAFMIFCIPAVPKAFKGDGVIALLHSSLKFWTKGSMDRSIATPKSSWPQESFTTNKADTKYRKINEGRFPVDELPLAHMSTGRLTAGSDDRDIRGVL